LENGAFGEGAKEVGEMERLAKARKKLENGAFGEGAKEVGKWSVWAKARTEFPARKQRKTSNFGAKKKPGRRGVGGLFDVRRERFLRSGKGGGA